MVIVYFKEGVPILIKQGTDFGWFKTDNIVDIYDGEDCVATFDLDCIAGVAITANTEAED